MSQQINLFNPIFLKEKKYFSAVTMVQSLVILVAGMTAFYAYAKYQVDALERRAVDTAAQHKSLQERLTRTTAQFAPKTTDAGLVAALAGLQAQHSARMAMIGSLGTGELSKESGYAEYMRALARQSLDGLWLTGFRVGEGGEQVEINGRALQPALVPAFISRLHLEKVMQGRAFDALTMTQRQAPLPAAPVKRLAGAPTSYAYTEFRLGSAHAAPKAEADVQPQEEKGKAPEPAAAVGQAPGTGGPK
jgi:hypothetical protein